MYDIGSSTTLLDWKKQKKRWQDMVAKGQGRQVYDGSSRSSGKGQKRKDKDSSSARCYQERSTRRRAASSKTAENKEKQEVVVKQEDNGILNVWSSSEATEKAMNSKEKALEAMKSWLALHVFGGLAPLKEEIEKFTSNFIEAGWSSKELIQNFCTEADVLAFNWMDEPYKRAFLARAKLEN